MYIKQNCKCLGKSKLFLDACNSTKFVFFNLRHERKRKSGKGACSLLFEVSFTAFPLKLGAWSYVSQGSFKVFSATIPSKGHVCSRLSYLLTAVVEHFKVNFNRTNFSRCPEVQLDLSTLVKLVNFWVKFCLPFLFCFVL